MEPSPFRKIRTVFAALLAAAATGTAIPAYASAFTVTSATSGQTTTFTVTRSGDTSVAETVAYRAVSRSALAGLHFRETAGRLAFAAGQTSLQVSVEERTTAQIDDPRFTYFQSGGATGASRAYRFEVVDEGGFPVAAADRSIDYGSSNSVSAAAFAANALAVSSGEITVTDGGYAQAYHAVPLSSYFSSAVPQNYLAASGARIRMTLDFQAKEVDDGYQYVQILADQTSACDSGAGSGDPGTLRASSYLAGFELWKGNTLAEYATLSFPVTSAGNNCGAVSTPWKDTGHNDLGNLCQQRFAANCRAADGRLSLPASLSTLGVRFDASGSGNDDWVAKSVVARLQAVPAGPSLLASRPVVTPAPVCKGATVAVSLAFSEIVTVSSPSSLALSTSWGDLPYAAGSGANVLTFAGPVTAAAGTPLRVTGLSGGTVRGLAGDAFAWPGNLTADRTVDSLPTPPREAATGFYLLSTPAHLRWLSERIASYPATSAALADDIDLSAAGSFPAMGCSAGFAGVFDGRGHALAGLSVTAPDSSGASPARYGLFGLVAAQGVVTNLALSGATVSASGNPALVGAVCGRNLGTIDHCSVSGGQVSTAPRDADGTGTALGGVCGENAGTVRACRAVAPLASGSILLFNRVSNDAVGGIAGVNAASGTLEACYFHAWFDNVSNVNITRGAICGSNAGTVRRCGGLHDNRNYFDGAVGSGAGTVEDTSFPAASAFSSGEVCYALNGGVTDGSQPWYQDLDSWGFEGGLPVFAGPTVYLHGSEGYVNTIDHTPWRIASDEPSPDYASFVWTLVCRFCGETHDFPVDGTAEVTRQPTCTEPGQTTWTYTPPPNGWYGLWLDPYIAVQPAPAALGHDWGAPVWNWNADYTAATATFACSRCDEAETVAAAVAHAPGEGDATNCTATVVHHGETFTDTVVLRPPVTYIDEDGTERLCTDFTVITNAAGNVGYGGGSGWYVVTNAVTISGRLYFRDYASHLILCDGATLAVTNANGSAIQAGDLAIYGQTNGTGTVTANGTNGAGISAADFSVTINGGTVTAIGGTGINAHYSVTINGGTVTATGRQYGIFAEIGSITLGWTNPTDSITASSYYAVDGVSVKDGQRLTDGSDIYQDMVDPAEIAGVTLRPAYRITLPEGVVAGGVVRQDGTTAYAIAGTNVTLSAAAPGYAIGTVTVNGVPLADGTCSFTASADVTIAATMTPVTYVVRFDAGGGEGSMPDQSFTYGAPQALTSNAFTRAGYTFAGWLGADGAIYPDGADVDRLYVRYIVRYADNKEDTWKRFDRMPYPGKTNDDYHLGDGALQNTENDNGLNLYTGFENSDWDPDDPYTAAIISQNAAWFDEHDARNGVSMKLIEDFPNFYKEPVVVAQDGVVTLVAQWGIPYIDADGAERTCTDFTVLTNATGGVTYGANGEESWYVVTNAVTISGRLYFRDTSAHLILCDGATLAVTNANGSAIQAYDDLTIYGQTNGTGTVTANGDYGIRGDTVTINGGTVTATGRFGIFAYHAVTINGGTVTANATGTNCWGIRASLGSTLGWTNPTDSITASSYLGAVNVKDGQRLTDGSAIYEEGIDASALAGVTLRPYLADTTPYAAWAAASGVSGAWDETDALGIHNVFRYAFDKPTGAFENPPLLGIAFASDGTALVLTPPLVNTVGFDFSLLATDDLAGANPATFPLAPSGTNAVPASSSSVRFFRLQAAER